MREPCLGTDPLTTSPGPGGCSGSACSRRTPPGATSSRPGPAAITGMNLFSKICLQPVGMALHKAGAPGSSPWATGHQNTALNFGSLFCASRVSFKASNQPKALTTYTSGISNENSLLDYLALTKSGIFTSLFKDSHSVCLLFVRPGQSLTIDFRECWVGARQMGDDCQFHPPVLRAGVHLSRGNLLFLLTR